VFPSVPKEKEVYTEDLLAKFITECKMCVVSPRGLKGKLD
jgi:hypothetical protein